MQSQSQFLPKILAQLFGWGYGDEAAMRRYIRHPRRMPIYFQVERSEPKQAQCCTIRHECGLCFQTSEPITRGAKIHVKISAPTMATAVGADGSEPVGFEAHGRVAWCRAEQSGYIIAVRFDDTVNRFVLRMVEQVCHIESYREQVRSVQGRVLTVEEAAREWIDKYAAAFSG